MEFFVELLLSCFVEGTEELAMSPKVPKWLSYTCGIILLLFYIAVFCLLFFVSFIAMKANKMAGILILLLFLVLLFFFIKKAKEVYRKIKR